jgi:Arc/MetJ family transcription regulator
MPLARAATQFRTARDDARHTLVVGAHIRRPNDEFVTSRAAGPGTELLTAKRMSLARFLRARRPSRHGWVMRGCEAASGAVARDEGSSQPGRQNLRIYKSARVYTETVTKHLVDLDDEILNAARAELGTTTIKETINEALRLATVRRGRRVAAALDLLAGAHLDDRSDAWR